MYRNKEFVFEAKKIFINFCDVFIFHLQASAVEDWMSQAYENFNINLERVQVLYAKKGKKGFFLKCFYPWIHIYENSEYGFLVNQS